MFRAKAVINSAGGASHIFRPRSVGEGAGRTWYVLDSKEKEDIDWEDFLDMTVGQAVVWASQNIDPKEKPSELITSEPYAMGSHATCSGAWASGPEDCAPADYRWGYNG